MTDEFKFDTSQITRWMNVSANVLMRLRCKSQYKNAGFGQNKNVGFPTFLFCLFNHHQSLAEADLLICRKDH